MTQVRLPILEAMSPLKSSKSIRNSLKSPSVGWRSPSTCLLVLPFQMLAQALSLELELLKGLEFSLELERKGRVSASWFWFRRLRMGLAGLRRLEWFSCMHCSVASQTAILYSIMLPLPQQAVMEF